MGALFAFSITAVAQLPPFSDDSHPSHEDLTGVSAMFDEGTKVTLFCIGLAAWIFTLAAEQNAPREDLATAVEASGLPSLPLSARPDGTPAQTAVANMRVSLGDGFEARLLNGYVIEGLVVTRREFRYDATSPVSPLDLGIVWGDLAKPGGIDGLEFRTAPRAIWTRPVSGADLPANWVEQVTNNHLVPADQRVNDALMDVEVGQHVRIRGYLVEITGDGISPWRSSTKRNDSTIFGGCEIILVTGIEVMQSAGEAA